MLPPVTPSPVPAPAPSAAGRPRSLVDSAAMAQLAVDLLVAPNNPIPLKADDVRLLLPYFRLVDAPQGARLAEEGDAVNTGHLLLVLEGQASVDVHTQTETVSLAVLGPGELIGEMALLDGQPRTASCSAISPLRAAGLSRLGLQRMIDEQPVAAARFLATVAQRMGDRLRALGDQLRMYADLLHAQQIAKHPASVPDASPDLGAN